MSPQVATPPPPTSIPVADQPLLAVASLEAEVAWEALGQLRQEELLAFGWTPEEWASALGGES